MKHARYLSVVLITIVLAASSACSSPPIVKNGPPGSDTPSTTSSAGTIPADPTSSAFIVIKYSPTFFAAGTRNMLVANVSIDNLGYDTFNTAPEQFSVVVAGTTYPCDTATSDLRTFDLPDGGKTRGKLSFEVPASAQDGYQLIYTGKGGYNVQWFEVPR